MSDLVSAWAGAAMDPKTTAPARAAFPAVMKSSFIDIWSAVLLLAEGAGAKAEADEARARVAAATNFILDVIICGNELCSQWEGNS
mmetsp:Transcript_10891/g.26189  ORF Transcript_10891/g.26189 Transcript_10891/m.26189 type:complete len:86 (-) Transcript_10891:87-344(-)